MSTTVVQRRVRYLVLAIGTIVTGLIVHLGGGILPPALRDGLGDALWAMMIVWLVSVVATRVPLRTRGLLAFAICVAVELSQLYQTPFLNAVRNTLPGRLVLGRGYDPHDFLAYAAGAVVAVIVARVKIE